MPPHPASLAEQIARPQRVAVLGRHGAGKTTLLAMLYREALAGRFSGVRLAASDSRTAAHLSTLAHRLEEGQAPPPTAAPAELRFRLHRGESEVELAFLDTLGDAPPHDCDAVWLCLEATQGGHPDDLPPGVPLAVVLTKADLLSTLEASKMRDCLDPFARGGHVLAERSPDRGTFAVSALGPCGTSLDGLETLIPSPLKPVGLETPLVWLADALHRQARDRLQRLFKAGGPGRSRALAAFRLRYPSDPLGQRLRMPGRWLFPAAWCLSALCAFSVVVALWPTKQQPAPPPVEEPTAPPPAASVPVPSRSDPRPDFDQHVKDWRRSLYSRLRGAFLADPGDGKALRPLAQDYLEQHPDGRWARQAREVRDWCDRIAAPTDYSVTVVSGVFSKKAAFAVSRGVSISVALEVAGETYGPSSIVKNSYFPEWNFTFPRKVRWKSGDSVRVIVTDNFFWKRKVSDVAFDGPLALARLDDSCDVGKGTLHFTTDLRMPSLPKGE